LRAGLPAGSPLWPGGKTRRARGAFAAPNTPDTPGGDLPFAAPTTNDSNAQGACFAKLGAVGDFHDVTGPDQTFKVRVSAAERRHRTCHSCIAQNSGLPKVRSADFPAVRCESPIGVALARPPEGRADELSRSRQMVQSPMPALKLTDARSPSCAHSRTAVAVYFLVARHQQPCNPRDRKTR